MGNMRRYGAPGNPETDEGREQRSGLIILQRSKDLMKYLYTSFVKYPRSEKLGFVADYKKCLFQFLILIITAGSDHKRKPAQTPENNFRQREQVKNACRLSLAVTTTLRTLALPR